MAKKSAIARDLKRAKLNAKFAKKRAELLESGDRDGLPITRFNECQRCGQSCERLLHVEPEGVALARCDQFFAFGL